MVVIEFAKSGRATCRTCNSFIAENTMKLGTTINNDGYLNVEWHHDQCFWSRRAQKYYKRKGKKINVLLRLNQFSGQEQLDATQLQELSDKILECNKKWGTKKALEAAGIEVDDAAEAVEAAVKKEKAEKRKAERDLKKEQEVEQSVDDKEEAVEVEEFTASGRRKRKTTK